MIESISQNVTRKLYHYKSTINLENIYKTSVGFYYCYEKNSSHLNNKTSTRTYIFVEGKTVDIFC